MAWPCKRIRLSADDNNDNNDGDDKAVFVAATNDVNTPFNQVEVKTETTVSIDDDVDTTSYPTSEMKPTVIDLTTGIDPPPTNPRPSFPHTAEVIKARYIKALQQFQRVSSLIDAVAAQQMKLEARRDHLQTLMTALSTVYKVVKEHRRPLRTTTVPLVCDAASTSILLSSVDSKVTSSTSADDLPVVEPPDAVQDLSLADGKVAEASAYERLRDVGIRDDGLCYYRGPTDATLVAAHTTRNRVDISLSSVDCPPPAHTAKVDITGYTYIVRNSYDAAATDV